MSKNASRGMLMLFPFLVGFACPATAAREARVSETYGKLPLHFEANRGQTHEDVCFLARGPGYSLFLTPTGTALTLTKQESSAHKPAAHGKPEPRGRATGTVLRMTFAGANPDPRVTGLEELPGKANYFIGNDPANWRTSVPTYAKVRYADLYPRIDLLYYGNQRQLEYDLVVRPGADPTSIVLDIQGADRLQVDAQGDLVLQTTVGPIRQRKPVIYQELDGVRKDIPGGYVLKGEHQVGFKVAAYDASQALVIDPVLSYSTYLGGSGEDRDPAIAVDAAGNAYVTGHTESRNFPTTTGAFQTGFGGGAMSSGQGDAFVTKLNPAGSALVYSTYLGGSGPDDGKGIAVDAAGNAYVTGSTASSNFPTTIGAFQTIKGGSGNAFVTKLNPTGSALVYSTYLGGSGASGDYGAGIAVDAAGNAYVTGITSSSDFPTTAGAFQTTFGGGLYDIFVTKLEPTGSALVYSTYLGGSALDKGYGIAVDTSGNAYVTGLTYSTDFPTTPGAIQTTYSEGGLYSGGDAFVTKLNAAGSALVYSTYLGGRGTDMGRAIALQYPNVYVTGHTESYDFPTTTGAFQTMHDAVSGTDVFVAKIADIMSPPAPTPAARAGFKGHGKADLLWRNSSTVENYVLLMNGTAITGKGSVRTEPDQNSKVAGVGDFNGDGTADILWRYSSTGENYVYLMNGTTITGEGYLAEADLNWQVAGVGDFNGDGKADILWRNSSTGENYVWLMNGTTNTGGSLRTQADLNWQVQHPK